MILCFLHDELLDVGVMKNIGIPAYILGLMVIYAPLQILHPAHLLSGPWSGFVIYQAVS